jgi:hypothetical protein
VLLRQLMAGFPYRLDTNFAKMDRIVHRGVEDFKTRVLQTKVHGLSISAWNGLLYRGEDQALRRALKERFDIKEEDAEKLLR